MADLEFFDKLLAAKEEPKDEAAAAAEGAATADVVSPAAKRRRRQLRGETASAVGRPTAAKEETWQENLTCCGCGRDRATGKAFVDPEAALDWAYPDGRGSWCHDCFSTWRTGYAQEHTLRLFEKWLLLPENLADFHVHLLVFLSLGFENCLQVRPAQLQGRVSLLRFIATLLGVPLTPFAVILVDGTSEPSATGTDPRSFVHVTSADGPRIGRIVPAPSSAAAMQRQPFARGFFNLWGVLPRETEPDVQQVLRMLGQSPAGLGSGLAASSALVSAVIPVASPPPSR